VVRGVALDSLTGGLRNGSVLLARIAATGVGALLVARGQITVGTLVAFLGYVAGLFGPVQGLTGVYQTLCRASVSFDTVFGILDARDHLGDAPDALEVRSLRGDVAFEGVRFAYGEDREPILDGIDLRIAAGETVAIVGPSGSGKTTLMALLQRLYDPTGGAVKVDGMDLRRLRQRSLRAQVGVVLQDAPLFNDSIRNIIAYGRPGASFAEVRAAARAANAAEFIETLPEGYDTVVGERASLLSGGQRQRIAIARALLKDPPILILDEATSALDAESEAVVQDALARLVRGRTTIIVAHRLATVVNADRIVVLKAGRVHESGTHEDLVRRRGYYASLVAAQTRGLVPVAAA
jgi:ATP-binding cassette subfamily B protein